MRLEGTLDAFGLPDILQLLAFTRKTGALRLSAPPAAGVVRVREGAICAASSDTSRQVLARRVVGAGLVGGDELAAAVEVAATGRHGVVTALVESGALGIDALLPLAGEQVTDAVGELLRWTGGEFSFVVDDADPDALPLQLPVDDVVTEGQRRLAVWAELTAVIPSAEIALALNVAPGTGDEGLHCNRDEWSLLALVDGTRTVAEMVALLGRSEFTVMRTLAGLVTRGLLVVPGAAGSGGGFSELERRQALLAGLETTANPAAPTREEPAAPTPSATPSIPSARMADLPATIVPEPSVPVVPPVAPPVQQPAPYEQARYQPSPSPTASAGGAAGSMGSADRPAFDGANALAPELLHAPAPEPLLAPEQSVRPALTLAVGPQDAPVRRSLLLRLTIGSG